MHNPMKSYLAPLAILAVASSIGVMAAGRGPEQDLAGYEDVAARLQQKGLRELGAYKTLTTARGRRAAPDRIGAGGQRGAG